MKILTCNIRCCSADDGENGWNHRKEFCIEVIRSQTPDIICFQEMQSPQFSDISPAFPEYNYYGMVDEIAGYHPLNSIFYRADGYTLVSSGGYWLSETPHIPGTKSWDSNCVRLANWVRLKDNKEGTEFRVINTHIDHISQPARENQARLIVEDSSAYPEDYPQILTGDMNCDSSNEAIHVFKQGGWIDTYNSVHGTEDPGNTFHKFLGPQFDADIGKMDWIFMRGGFKAVNAEVIKDSREGKFPSDHYFVSADVTV
ncbi:endonuclease/exonuclease/phosphatase family protein [Planctomycetota bacterium]